VLFLMGLSAAALEGGVGKERVVVDYEVEEKLD
jgi:hypothetical protein